MLKTGYDYLCRMLMGLISFFVVASSSVIASESRQVSDGSIPQRVEALEPATWGAIVSAVAGFISERDRKNSLRDLQAHIQNIENGVQTVIQQNEEILKRVIDLPSQVAAEIRKNELNRAYLEMKTTRQYFNSYKGGIMWGWRIDLQRALSGYNTIAAYDIGSVGVLRLVEWGEFLTLVSKGRLTPAVLENLKDRELAIVAQLAVLEADVSAESTRLRQLVENNNYVASFKHDAQLSNLTWVLQADRTRTETYQCNCRMGRCEDYQTCSTCQRDVLDTNYRDARQRHDNAIKESRERYYGFQMRFADLDQLLNGVVRPYIKALEKSLKVGVSEETEPEFIDRATAKGAGNDGQSFIGGSCR